MIIDASISFWRQVAKIVFLSLFLSCISAISVSLLFPTESPAKFDLNLLNIFIIFVVLGPLIESILVITSVLLFSLFIKNKLLISILSGLILAILHGVGEIALSIIVFFPFVLYAFSYQIWHVKNANKAFWLISLSHAIHNAIAISFANIIKEIYI
jgi:hypothetical protein